MPTTGGFHLDHIIPASRWGDYVAGRDRAVQPIADRRGPDHLGNYAWSCPLCNTAKNQQISHRAGEHSHRLFDPRYDQWSEHFRFFHNYLFIVGLSRVGRATEQALRFNHSGVNGPLGDRHDAILREDYPPVWARTWVASTEL